MSLISHFFASRIGRYVIGVLVAWILLFTIGYFRYGSTPGHPVLHVSSEAFCSACCPCTSRRVSTERTTTTRTPRVSDATLRLCSLGLVCAPQHRDARRRQVSGSCGEWRCSSMSEWALDQVIQCERWRVIFAIARRGEPGCKNFASHEDACGRPLPFAKLLMQARYVNRWVQS